MVQQEYMDILSNADAIIVNQGSLGEINALANWSWAYKCMNMEIWKQWKPLNACGARFDHSACSDAVCNVK